MDSTWIRPSKSRETLSSKSGAQCRNVSSFHVRNEEESSGAPLDEYPTGLVGRHGNNTGEHGFRAEITVEFQQNCKC